MDVRERGSCVEVEVEVEANLHVRVAGLLDLVVAVGDGVDEGERAVGERREGLDVVLGCR
jgi:hypothetical protein